MRIEISGWCGNDLPNYTITFDNGPRLHAQGDKLAWEYMQRLNPNGESIDQIPDRLQGYAQSIGQRELVEGVKQ